MSHFGIDKMMRCPIFWSKCSFWDEPTTRLFLVQLQRGQNVRGKGSHSGHLVWIEMSLGSSVGGRFFQSSARGMHHTSTSLYFYRASKKSLHKPRTTSGNRLFHISYGFNYYLQLTFVFTVSIYNSPKFLKVHF
jgi:hypothetical protein